MKDRDKYLDVRLREYGSYANFCCGDSRNIGCLLAICG